jgi:hypothetical protein
MDILASKRFRQICDGVWRDRAQILTGRGILSGEAALVRAAYWRLCKAGGTPGQSSDDYTPFLNELVRQYRDEGGPQLSGSNGGPVQVEPFNKVGRAPSEKQLR